MQCTVVRHLQRMDPDTLTHLDRVVLPIILALGDGDGGSGAGAAPAPRETLTRPGVQPLESGHPHQHQPAGGMVWPVQAAGEAGVGFGRLCACSLVQPTLDLDTFSVNLSAREGAVAFPNVVATVEGILWWASSTTWQSLQGPFDLTRQYGAPLSLGLNQHQ